MKDLGGHAHLLLPEASLCGKAASQMGPLVPAAAAKSLQSCLTLCNPIDGSPPGSPVSGILQARTLEWVAISLNQGKLKVVKQEMARVNVDIL